MPVALVERLAGVLERIESRLTPAIAQGAPSLLTIEQVGVMLGKPGRPMSRRQVERLVKAGKLRKVPNLGKRTTRFRPTDVERLVAGDEQQPGRRRL